jgi:uncharacterized membrane protein
MANLKPEEKNLVDIAIDLLTELKISFSVDYVKDFLMAHKDFPTLMSIAALLDDFNIENIPVKISVSQLSQVEGPSVAFIKSEERNKFVVIRKINSEGSITYFDSENGDVSESLSNFESKWIGVSLLAEKGEYSFSRGNRDYIVDKKKKKISKIISLVLLSTLLVSFLADARFSGIFVLLFLLKVLGITFSLLLLFKDFGLNTKLTDTVCSMGGISKNIGCDKVSLSNASSFWIFRMSEVGVFYFVGGFIGLSIAVLTDQGSILFLLFLSSALSLPYTFFSIYYQWRVAKQLCPLCTFVMIVLWSEFIVLYFSSIGIAGLITSTSIALTIFSFSVPVLFWLAFRDEIAQNQVLSYEKRKLIFFSSPEVMKASIATNKIVFKGEFPETIKLNNGDFKITVVLSLSCAPCMITFFEIIYLAARYQDIQFNILLSTGDSSSIEKAKALVKRKLKYGDTDAIDYLKSLYSKSGLEELNADTKFDVAAEEIVKSWFSWIIQNNIDHTPAIYLENSLTPNYVGLYDFEPLFRHLRKVNLLSTN